MILAKYLGHAKIDETLNTYSHLFKTQMDEVVNLMNKMNENYDNQNKQYLLLYLSLYYFIKQ